MALPAMKQADSRQDKRGQIHYRIHFSAHGRRHAGDGHLADLSASGCCIKSSVAVQQGEVLELTIQANDGKIVIVDESVVRWVRPDGFGVAFKQMRRPAALWVADVCRRLALYR
ncbi:hypothetical protein YTPLAS18_28010 [Nitrospira sp.]|nr:hypothetical protein YTPLAS18_28010 [Nitrospira sp.]